MIIAAGIIPARAGFTVPPNSPGREDRDHPRSRGVYGASRTGTSAASGSSPLARGLRGLALPPVRYGRIIPARAGFTTPSSCPKRLKQDHPRSRGVYDIRLMHTTGNGGSSPLARGLRPSQGRRVHRQWIIPARAGFTGSPPLRRRNNEDHPRSRGVYSHAQLVGTSCSGSSPLARGLQIETMVLSHHFGIIPARAGFTPGKRRDRYHILDHPRSRGVYLMPYGAPSASEGSSPLARGLLMAASTYSVLGGIIPARAGFTVPSSCQLNSSRDHPRSRGVYSAARRRPRCAEGSSPLARGLRGPRPRRARTRGIIPARAGFTCACPRRRGTRPDHPRSRGVYSATASQTGLT